METVHHNFPAVETIAFIALPERAWPDAEPFHPSLDDEAEMIGLEVGRADGEFRAPASWTANARVRLALGRQRGLAERGLAERRARELGYELAMISDAGEAPGGYDRFEARAWREGFAEGLQERERIDARIDRLATEQAEWDDAGYGPIRDRDVYRAGCVS